LRRRKSWRDDHGAAGLVLATCRAGKYRLMPHLSNHPTRGKVGCLIKAG
jgi:hypothetical protein